MKKISMFLRNQPPGRMIVGGFAAVILFGMILLLLPISVKDGAEVSAIDALFTSTSAVCVTGLIAIDTAAVSYTHLDVYKRQQWSSSTTSLMG